LHRASPFRNSANPDTFGALFADTDSSARDVAVVSTQAPLVAVVSTERLTLSRQQQCNAGRAREKVLMISEEEFAAIRACVAKAFGFSAGSYICDALTKESKIAVDEI